MSEQHREQAVILTGGARSARASLGPTAWAVLEELTLGAERGEDGRLVVTTSVRRLAAALGLDKDTVGRALARLTAGGFVFRRAAESAAKGSCYVVAPIAGLTRIDDGSGPVLPTTAVRPSNGDKPQRPEVGDGARPRRPRQAPSTAGGRTPRSAQLSLLDDDAAPNDATTDAPSQTPPPATSTQSATPIDQPDAEPDDDHHHRHPIPPIRTPDSCHVCDEADATGPGGRSGGGAKPC